MDEAGFAQASSPFQPSHNFDEPWQADAFATAISLSRKGVFTWAEWVTRFSAVIRDRPRAPSETDSAAYFRQWMECLQSLVTEHCAVLPEEVGVRQRAWHEAYLRTPHGESVSLERLAGSGDAGSAEHDHRHDDHHHHGHHHHNGLHHHHHHEGHGHDGIPPKPTPIFVERRAAG